MPITVHCHWCGKPKSLPPSQVKDRNFCSRKHWREWQRSKARLVRCAYCDAPKELIASYPERDRYFCDTVCMGEWQAEHWRDSPESHPRWRGDDLLVHCANCGEPKRTTAQKIGDYDRHFCDAECKAEWMSQNLAGANNPFYKGKITVACAWCGEPKEVYPHIAEIYDHHFCNGDCYGQWRAENVVGENHPQWSGGPLYNYGPNWLIQRRKARKRDGYRCQHCGIHERQLSTELHVHHIVPFRQFGLNRYRDANRLSNLISLCSACHKSAEYGNIEFQPFLL